MPKPPQQPDYYAARAAAARALAERAPNPVVAAVHAEFARRYELLAEQPDLLANSTWTSGQAT